MLVKRIWKYLLYIEARFLAEKVHQWMVSLIGNSMGVLRQIGISDDIFFFPDADLFLLGKINLLRWLLLAATRKTD
jgi:hypothetical protein